MDYIFVGPSAFPSVSTIESERVHVQPPVRRGDVESLVDSFSPGTIILVDGIFGVTPAVGHAEIRNALATGWEIWGLSSMGAIRAFEMREFGVRGFGYVYEQFLTHEDFCDDELCLLHSSTPPYQPVTEALVNVRYIFDNLPNKICMSQSQRNAVIGRLRSVWFGERDHDFIKKSLMIDAGLNEEDSSCVIYAIKETKIKNLDFADFLDMRYGRK